jgi:cyclopropane fatty-acyl-phospholipid synthase-like methyltransferase
MITLGIWLAERGMLPDFILRVAVKFLSKARVRMPNVFSEKLKVLNTLKEGPIAESTSSANEQHYEVPPIFFEKVLGENLKYSCCLYNENNKDLNSAEIFMLDKYLDRADIKSNQEILDLGCGWGSFTLHAAKKFPQSNFTSISNSKDQIDFINARATALNLTNVKAIRQNINELNLDKKFDRHSNLYFSWGRALIG